MKKILLIVFIPISIFSQKEYGREMVDKLASDAFFGRGYVNEGDKIAADFIAEQFKKYGAKPIDSSYFQGFTLDVNTFPGKVEVAFGGVKLKPGEDFMISPSSGSAEGNYKLKEISSDNIESILSKKDFSTNNSVNRVAYVIEFEKPKDRNERGKQQYLKKELAKLAPLIVVNDEKYTYGVGRDELPNPIVNVKSDFVKGDSVYLNIKNEFVEGYKTQNVLAMIPAKRKCKRDKYIFFTAHYDHLGMMGSQATMNGANDNASGTAMMLALMKFYSEKKPEYTMVFIAFGGEEVGLIGSKYFVDNPLVPLKDIKFVINVDLMGTGSEGITVVNATENPKQFSWLEKINKKKGYLKQVKKRGKSPNSDHHWFQENGVPAFFIYTMGGVTHYHDIKDRPETLPLTKFNELHKFIRDFVKKF